ncbi:MAG: MlaD family protein [Cardiobacteriaceae bacterium]|nr:MlaD family protein [Cardiobacteriaceae bacterium]
MGQLPQDLPTPELNERSHKNGYGLLWLLPLLALAIGLYLAYQRLNDTGERIQLTFRTAEGLQAGKTKVRYKEVDVGTVTDVHLADDLTHIIVTAQMVRSANPLLREDSVFWVVKPEISATGVSGLGTLISGSYIAVAPGSSPEHRTKFTGAEETPFIPPSEKGLRIRLITDSAAGVHQGTSIYYRGIKVGSVDQVWYNDHDDRIELSTYIIAPYHQLINSNTKFWNVSGFNFSLGASGAELQMQSLESLLLGGITFSTPTSLNPNIRPVEDNAVFTLYDSERATTQVPSGSKQYYVVYFEDSVRGLRVGAPVAFNGIDIGQVIDIRLLYDETSNKAAIPVLIEVEPDRIERLNGRSDKEDIIAALVGKGLQASMETDSLITGDKYIKLSVYPDDIKRFGEDPYSAYAVMPSRSTGITRITDGVTEIVDKVRKLPIDSLADKAGATLDSAASAAAAADRLLSAKDTQALGKSLNDSVVQFGRTMKSVESAGNGVGKTLANLDRQIAALAKQLEETLHGIGPDSPLYWTLRETLKDMSAAANAIDVLFKKLDHKPNSLVFGE